MHRIWCSNFGESTYSSLSADSTCRQPIWQKGRPFRTGEYNLERLCFQSETPHSKPFPDFSLSDLGCPVMSAKLRHVLEDSGIDNVDFYPATVVEHGETTRRSGYFAANVIGLVSCMNREESDFREVEDVVYRIEKLVLDEGRAGDFLLFRLAEMPHALVVHERVAQRLIEAELSGFQLLRPEEWDGLDGKRPPDSSLDDAGN